MKTNHLLMVIMTTMVMVFASCKEAKEPNASSKVSEPSNSEEIVIPDEENEDVASNQSEPGSITGVYMFGDANNTWFIQINSDETARCWNKKDVNNISYGSWTTGYKEGEIWLDIDEFDNIVVNTGKGSLNFDDAFGHVTIYGNWLYLDSDAAKAKDPTKRVAIKKVK